MNTTLATDQLEHQRRNIRNVILASFVGSAVDYYDFLLYSQEASLVFGTVFFARVPPSVALILSFSTLAVGYVIRPLGGILFGHFGDRLGRKRMLVITMSLMGAATFLIGCIPSYATIGVAAPLILILLRILQGIAVGGDFGGAVSISLESSDSKRHGFMGSFVQMGAPTGATLASIVMAILGYMNHSAFLDWGWRIPFFISAVLVIFGLVVRLRMVESPEFLEAQVRSEEKQKQQKKESAPFIVVLRDHWKILIIAVLGPIGALVLQGLTPSYILSLATTTGGHSQSTAEWAFAIGSVIQIFVCMIAGHFSDRFGRNRVMIIGNIVGIVMAVPALWLAIQTADAFLFIGMITVEITVGILYGPASSYIAERFPVKVRYTGSSLGYQLTSTLGSGIGPLVAASLAALAGWGLVSAFIAASYVLGLIAVLIGVRGHQQPKQL